MTTCQLIVKSIFWLKFEKFEIQSVKYQKLLFNIFNILASHQCDTDYDCREGEVCIILRAPYFADRYNYLPRFSTILCRQVQLFT